MRVIRHSKREPQTPKDVSCAVRLDRCLEELAAVLGRVRGGDTRP